MILALAQLVLAQTGDSWDMQFNEPFVFDRQVAFQVLDLLNHTPEDVARVRAAGVTAICYVSVGTIEDWRPDLALFPPGVIGKPLPDWEGERYLDIRQLDVLLPIMSARFRDCKAAGYDGVAPDNQDVMDNDSGFPITGDDTVAYLRELANLAHAMDLVIGQRNLPDLSGRLVGDMDYVMAESCFEWDFCADMRPYSLVGKPVFDVEYIDSGIDWTAACAAAKDLGISMILKDRELTGVVWEGCE
jgi:hypothetical protein